MTQQQRGWFTRRVFPDGEEPDPRFTLANERTFLAWTRTALAFLAGGIALEALGLPGLAEGPRSIAAALLVLTAMAISLGAALRWVRLERALRHARPLPAPAIAPLLGVAIVVACLAIFLGLF
ncbi:YidH family protein [Corynebacterium auris]|uniref:YidH family protein n=1 Tax=Corynebacterium auris TaxID=44750 RepID=UPI0025B4C115|nr:DUF202 domain-containing protein [Corynebacterium auris]WJY69081.1 Inner membrane protein YidH [Corynebacterium auris]